MGAGGRGLVGHKALPKEGEWRQKTKRAKIQKTREKVAADEGTSKRVGCNCFSSSRTAVNDGHLF